MKEDYTEDLTAKVNVFAYREISKRMGKTFYDGFVFFRNEEYLISGGPGRNGADILGSVDDLAGAIMRILRGETHDLRPKQKEDLAISYHSRLKINSRFGVNGYSGPDGSFENRPLTTNEMRSLMKAVDSKVRPIFWK